jgi:hypothetical protein
MRVITLGIIAGLSGLFQGYAFAEGLGCAPESGD